METDGSAAAPGPAPAASSGVPLGGGGTEDDEMGLVQHPDGRVELVPVAGGKRGGRGEGGKPLTPAQKELAVQAFALKLLAGV